jgi:hypothetical protein
MERFLVPFATAPPAAQSAIERLRMAQIAVIGRARRARMQTVTLIGEIHLSMTTLDPDLVPGTAADEALTVTLVSACTDPGISAREALFFDNEDTALVVHPISTGERGETIPTAEIQARWPAMPIIRADSGDLLRAYVQQRLVAALQRWCQDSFRSTLIDTRVEQRLINAYQCFKELIV